MDGTTSNSSGAPTSATTSNVNTKLSSNPSEPPASPQPLPSDDQVPTPKYFVFWSTLPTPHPFLSHSLVCTILLFLSATNSLPLFQSIVHSFLSKLSLFLLRVTFISTAILSLLHQTGALRRYALQFAEKELSKVMNNTLVTLSDIKVDLWRGRVVIQDLVIHNKDRSSWEWESPCLARVGRIEAELNFTSVIELPFYGPILNHTFKDVYTGLVEDVQVFVEKRRNIFNFHLLDGSLDIPDHTLIMEEFRRRKGFVMRDGDQQQQQQQQQATGVDGLGDDGDSFLTLSQSMSLDRDEDRGDFTNLRDGGSPKREKEDEANLIVEKLVGAVSNLGKAATDGGSKGLQSALRNQKDSLVKSFKQLHKQSSTMNNIPLRGDDQSTANKRTPKKDRVAESVSVIRQLGKVMEQNVSDIKDQMGFLSKPPPRKEGLETQPADIVRIGSFLLREMRIFTKDVLVSKGKSTNTTVTGNISNLDTGYDTMQDDHIALGWSRPIVIWELAITGAELSPPMSARDPTTGLPVVGIPIDRVVDIVLKRLVAEAAKSNTGSLFHTAFGDVFSFMDASRRKETGVEK
eukprot:scaffold1992_cov203-Alexandrium_tamarense.AAC.20